MRIVDGPPQSALDRERRLDGMWQSSKGVYIRFILPPLASKK